MENVEIFNNCIKKYAGVICCVCMIVSVISSSDPGEDITALFTGLEIFSQEFSEGCWLVNWLDDRRKTLDPF